VTVVLQLAVCYCVCITQCVVGLMDAVHKAAFRGTLGRSLYMNPDRVGSYSTKAVSRLVPLH